MKEKIVVIGAGGHGREAIDVIRENGMYDVEGVIADDRPSDDILDMYGVKYLGGVEYLLDKKCKYVIAIGNCSDREKIYNKLSSSRCFPVNILHPSSYTGSNCKIGDGVMMYSGARVTTNVSLGNHVHLNVNSVVSHDCCVGDFSIVSPGAMLNGNVSVGKGTFIGTGAIVLPKIVIGDGVMVGAGAVVTKNIPSYETYIGIPARRM